MNKHAWTVLFVIYAFFKAYSAPQEDYPISPQQEKINLYIREANQHIDFINWLTERVYKVEEALLSPAEERATEHLIRLADYINSGSKRPDLANTGQLSNLGESLKDITIINTQLISSINSLRASAFELSSIILDKTFENKFTKTHQVIQAYKQELKLTHQARTELLSQLHPNTLLKDSSNNPWVHLGESILPIIDQAEGVIHHSNRSSNFRMETKLVELEKLNNELKIFTAQKEQNLEGLLRLSENRGNNPDNAYKWIKRTATSFLTKNKDTSYIDIRNDQSLNDIIDIYNKVVDMALLKSFNANTHPRYFENKTDNLRPVFLPYYLKGISYHPKTKNDFQAVAPTTASNSLDGYAFNNLIFVLDISASMAQQNKLEHVKTALKQLIGIMRPEDEITVITYAGEAKKVVKPSSATKEKYISKKIDKLKPGGSTNLLEGMKLAFKEALSNYKTEGNNRVILVTDGAVRATSHLVELVNSHSKEQVHLSLLSFQNENDQSLKTLSNNSNAYLSVINQENMLSTLIIEAQRGGKANN
ncbi:hypothetical protein GCM10027429_00490 [Marivirga atlantica]|uniref:VWA domain-containing protein n=1 Tax=Marivirga atlantica TaxID=1548457 RepID=A0A937ADI8_9BACT|nr:VWA domain-containing protein [Marivirga atlantica]MBL0763659.1 VWA domain-containing protein [Marivirga atlantica]